jgi:formylglycine-generating enzyme required for sulfatase activity/serine/threonine protein kinase
MEQIGPYDILKRLGGGGFGEVWLGENELRQVAIKVFSPTKENLDTSIGESGADSEALPILKERFLNEARILAELEANPHIISVYEFGKLDDGSPYYVMPFLPVSLADRLGKDIYDVAAIAELPESDRPKSLPLDDALRYFEQLLIGLSAAHKRGLIHRDIKPGNVMLTDDDQIRLVDFGIAKAPDSQHSVSQLGMGSQKYMAPEQRESAKHVDARADVYSAGVMAYRMITGRLPGIPFREPNVLVPELNQALNDLIVSCVSDDKAERPTDAAELLSRFRAANQALADVNATGTWVGDAGASSIRDELKPLRNKIETVLLAEGDMPEKDRAALRTLAMIVDLDDEGLDDLIEVTATELQAKLKPIQNLRKTIVAKAAENDVTEDDKAIFFEIAEQIGWPKEKVEALLQDGNPDSNPESNSDEIEEPKVEPAEPEAPAPAFQEPNSAATDFHQPEPERVAVEPAKSSGGRWGVLVLLALLVVGGGYGYTVYQDQQEQERIAAQQAAMESSKARDLKRQDDAAWAEAESTNTVAAYTAYTKQSFATTARKAEANQLIARLERADEQERQRLAKLEADRKAKAERDRFAKLEADRKAKAERDRLAKLEADRQADAARQAAIKKKEEERLAAEAEAERLRPGREFKDCSDCPELVVIPAGSFRMGDLSGGGDADEKPVHSVTVKSFALGKTEVTFAEYDVFARATNRSLPGDSGWGRGSRPVINVNWEDATAYVAWLSKKTGKSYRLPSESEWEYAARAGSTTKYSFGNSERDLCRYANHAYTSTDYDHRNQACSDGVGKQTAPVGSYEANDFGLLDMHGNVYEWTQDCWNGSYAGAPSDGSAWTRGDCDRRVLRGGSWATYRATCARRTASGTPRRIATSTTAFVLPRTCDA